MRFSSSLLLLISLFAQECLCTELEIQPRIVGGRLADIDEYESYVHGTNGELCGGTLIHPDIVLTAAHCETSFSGEFVFVGANHLFGQDGAERVPIEFVYPHEAYTPGPEENDIMLIKLGKTSSAPIKRINEDPDLPVEGQSLMVIGFGRIKENGDLSDDLMEVDVDAVGTDSCMTLLPGVIFEDSHLCAGGGAGGKDSCEGDSGGPLLDMLTGTQYGIVTFGVGCARPNTPGVYTRVSHYIDWIQNFICEQSSVKPDYCPTEGGTEAPPAETERVPVETDSPVSETEAPPVETDEPSGVNVSIPDETETPPTEQTQAPPTEETESPPLTEPVPEEDGDDENTPGVTIDVDNFVSSVRDSRPSNEVIAGGLGLLWLGMNLVM